jgi:hypothetical protein
MPRLQALIRRAGQRQIDAAPSMGDVVLDLVTRVVTVAGEVDRAAAAGVFALGDICCGIRGWHGDEDDDPGACVGLQL